MPDDAVRLEQRIMALEFIVQGMLYENVPPDEDPVEHIKRKRDEMVSRLDAAFHASGVPGEELGQMEIVALIDAFWENCARRAQTRRDSEDPHR